MPRFTITFKIQKISKQVQCSSFQELSNKIQLNFNIQAKNIIFVKPRIKNEEQFAKNIKEGDQIIISGKVEKQKSKQQLQKLQKTMQQVEELKKKMYQKQNQQQKLINQPFQKILRIRSQRQKGLKHKGIQYFDYQQRKFIDLGIQYALCPLHLLVRVPQFVQYCQKQSNISQKIEGLLIEELRIMFWELSEKKENVSLYCYKQNNNNQILKTQKPSLLPNFKKCQTGQQKIQIISNSFAYNQSKKFGQYGKSNIGQLRQQFSKPDHNQNINYYSQFICPFQWISSWLQYCCDFLQIPYPTLDFNYFLNRTFKTIRKNQWNVLQKKQIYFYNDKYVVQKIFGIVVKIQQQDAAQYEQYLNQNQKQKKEQSIKFLLQCDLSQPQFFSIFLGIKERFKKKIIYKDMCYQDRTISQTILSIQQLPKYVFIHLNRFEYLPEQQIGKKIKLSQRKKSFHQVQYSKTIDFKQLCSETLAQNVKNEKIVYQLIGVIFHKGNFYHQINFQHKDHDCRGDFQTMVHDSGDKWLKFHRAQVEQIEINDVINKRYWGNQNQWTPILLLYKQQYEI